MGSTAPLQVSTRTVRSSRGCYSFAMARHPFRMALTIAVVLAARGDVRASQQTAASPLRLAEQIVFLYYADLTAADNFFSKALGLEKTMDRDWVKIYRTVNGSSIGAVKEGRGFHKTADSKPVMITWAVENIDPWYQRVTAAGVKVLKAPHVATDPPARSFLVADSTGYTFEFLQWLRP